MKKTPLLSVIIPVYNVEQYLSRCIESILAQGMTHEMEIIVVNDGSTDGSLKIAEEYADKYPDVLKVLDIPNAGVANARNLGLDTAQGKWVWFCDADDHIKQGALKYVMDSFLDDKIDIFSFALANDEVNNASAGKTQNTVLSDVLYDGDGFEYFKSHRIVFVWNNIYKRKFISDVRFKKYPIEDVAFNIEVFIRKPRYRVVNTEVYYYNIGNSGSITKQRNVEKMREYVDGFLSMFTQLHDFGEKDENLKPVLLEQGSYCAVKFVSRLLSANYSREKMKTIVQQLKSVGFFPFVEKSKFQKVSNFVIQSVNLYPVFCFLYNYFFIPFVLPRLSRL